MRGRRDLHIGILVHGTLNDLIFRNTTTQDLVEKKVYMMGIDPTTSRMRIQRSAIWATRTNLSYADEFVLRARICTEKWVSSALSAKSPFLQFSFWELVGK